MHPRPIKSIKGMKDILTIVSENGQEYKETYVPEILREWANYYDFVDNMLYNEEIDQVDSDVWKATAESSFRRLGLPIKHTPVIEISFGYEPLLFIKHGSAFEELTMEGSLPDYLTADEIPEIYEYLGKYF